MAVFKLVAPAITINNKSTLTCFQQFILVLIKLRLNTGNQDLAYRFGVNQSTVARYIQKMIDVLYITLGPLVKWPTREEVLKTMSIDFRSTSVNAL